MIEIDKGNKVKCTRQKKIGFIKVSFTILPNFRVLKKKN